MEVWILCVAPVNISLTSSSPSLIMSGTTVNLTCSVSLPIEVDISVLQWKGPGDIPTPTNSTMGGGKRISSILTFNQITTSQSGLYTCNFTLGGSISKSINITVLGKCQAAIIICLLVMHNQYYR